jgi:hypothetical protein
LAKIKNYEEAVGLVQGYIDLVLEELYDDLYENVDSYFSEVLDKEELAKIKLDEKLEEFLGSVFVEALRREMNIGLEG